ncbi:MAG: ribonuclease P protein component [Minisyncoccota bacterium]
MFSRRERLSRAQFGAALKARQRLSSDHFWVIVREESRGYAVVIPKKIVRLSSARHRLKRQVLEALRELPLPPSLIVFPRASAHGVHYQDIKKELGTLLSKIRH